MTGSGKDLVPASSVAHGDETFRWRDKRLLCVKLDAAGVPTKEIAAQTGFSVNTIYDLRTYPQYREKLTELRAEVVAEIMPKWYRFQSVIGDGIILAVHEAIAMLSAEKFDSEGHLVPNYHMRNEAIKRLMELGRLGFLKVGVSNEDGGQGIINFVQATLHVTAGPDGLTVEEGSYTVLEGDASEDSG